MSRSTGPGRDPRRWTLALSVLVAVLAALALWTARTPVVSVPLGDGVEVRFPTESAWPSLGGDAEFPLTVAGHEVPEIELASTRELSAVTLEFEKRATASIELQGGQVAERILLPDGRVQFRITPEADSVRRSPWPWGPRYRYRLVWVMPGAPGGPLGLKVTAEPSTES